VSEINKANQLKTEILRLSREYSRLIHGAQRPGADPARAAWSQGQVIPYAGRTFTEDEVEAAVGATLDFWLTLGPEGEAFERELASFLGAKHSILVNSGSSANLLALSALTSYKLPAELRLNANDEVITVAAGFPTTVAPILQVGAVPVFIDNDPATGNVRVEQLEAAYCAGKTKAVMIAHTLGNPFDIAAVLRFCRERNLWMIEDNCDSLGSTYSMPIEQARSLGLDHLLKAAEAGAHSQIRFDSISGRQVIIAPTGVWGDISTQSFYPPHHLTMGEGGAVNVAHRAQFKNIIESFRDWGRDCWCQSGKDNTCRKRFGWQLGELPKGYDHKYIYTHLGYNLKPLDPQAAIGREQLKKLPAFIDARKRNWAYLRSSLADLDSFFEYSLPTHATAWSPAGFTWGTTGCRVDCAWFGFMLRVLPDAPFSNSDLARHLDEKKIGNRMLFGGNLVRQPAFVQLKQDRPAAFRTVGALADADTIMRTALFLGTYPGLTNAMLDYEIEVIHDFVAGRKR